MPRKEKLCRGMVRDTTDGYPVTVIEAIGVTFVKIMRPDGKLDAIPKTHLILSDVAPDHEK